MRRWTTAEEFWELCRNPPRSRRFVSYPGELARVDPETGRAETWDEWVDSLEPELATLIRDASRARTPEEIVAAKAAVEELALRDPGNSLAIVVGEMLAARERFISKQSGRPIERGVRDIPDVALDWSDAPDLRYEDGEPLPPPDAPDEHA